jgi:hypothetical protein
VLVRCAFSAAICTLEDAIEFHAFAPLKASRCVTNAIHLGCPLTLPVGTVNPVQTLKEFPLTAAHHAPAGLVRTFSMATATVSTCRRGGPRQMETGWTGPTLTLTLTRKLDLGTSNSTCMHGEQQRQLRRRKPGGRNDCMSGTWYGALPSLAANPPLATMSRYGLINVRCSSLSSSQPPLATRACQAAGTTRSACFDRRYIDIDRSLFSMISSSFTPLLRLKCYHACD